MKMRLLLFSIGAPLIFLVWACAPSQIPVSLRGKKIDLAQLEGQWVGDYFSKDTGRSGVVEFMLTADQKKAFGDVLMIPRGSREPYHPVDFRDERETEPPIPELLTINFVEVLGGKVRGELTPYWDPELQRRVYTTFEGTVAGDTIQGTFESRIEQSPIYFYGQWKASRKKK